MSLSKENREKIIQAIIEGIALNSLDVNLLAEKYQVSRQTVYRYIRKLKEENIINQQSEGAKYCLTTQVFQKTYPNQDLSEDMIWRNDLRPFLEDVKPAAFKILDYSVNEMINNAIDHSEAREITIYAFKNCYDIKVLISDNGVGIFQKIQDSLGLPEKRFAILELAKGKVTTDPDHHTGEGIFFSSKAANRFIILSDELIFTAGRDDREILREIKVPESFSRGTTVGLGVLQNTNVELDELFHHYTEYPEDFGFNKTTVPVKLLDYGEESPIFVSRSQAKRLLAGFEKFDFITLDFSGVEAIRQGFADEVFRVFPNEHPQCAITPINYNEQINAMIQHVKNTK